jgi:hypothetical protein
MSSDAILGSAGSPESVIRIFCRPGQDVKSQSEQKEALRGMCAYPLAAESLKRTKRDESELRTTMIKEVKESLNFYEDELKRIGIATDTIAQRVGSSFVYRERIMADTQGVEKGEVIHYRDYEQRYYLRVLHRALLQQFDN